MKGNFSESKLPDSNLEIAVIVLTYNQEEILHECLDSIVSQKLDSAKIKIHVIDDASTDGTRSIIKRYQRAYPALIFPVFH